uniref:BZIP domain-containing protein n=1 Tax=Globodera pallida TaxID=36090 RepID=A0A183CMV2_GLOPA
MSMKAMGMGVPDYDPLYGYALSRPSSLGAAQRAVASAALAVDEHHQQQQLATLTAFSVSSAATNSPMDYTVSANLGPPAYEQLQLCYSANGYYTAAGAVAPLPSNGGVWGAAGGGNAYHQLTGTTDFCSQPQQLQQQHNPLCTFATATPTVLLSSALQQQQPQQLQHHHQTQQQQQQQQQQMAQQQQQQQSRSSPSAVPDFVHTLQVGSQQPPAPPQHLTELIPAHQQQHALIHQQTQQNRRGRGTGANALNRTVKTEMKQDQQHLIAAGAQPSHPPAQKRRLPNASKSASTKTASASTAAAPPSDPFGAANSAFGTSTGNAPPATQMPPTKKTKYSVERRKAATMRERRRLRKVN